MHIAKPGDVSRCHFETLQTWFGIFLCLAFRLTGGRKLPPAFALSFGLASDAERELIALSPKNLNAAVHAR